MQRDFTKIIIIILIIIMILTGILTVILYFKTDLLKSKDLLFKKYISQNIEAISEVLNFDTEEEYIKLLKNNDYSEKIDIALNYKENEKDEEENYKIEEQGIVNNSDNTSFRKIKSMYNNEKIIELDTLKQEDIYAVRFADIVNQFVGIKNSNLSYFISSLGYNGKYFSDKLNEVDVSELFKLSNEEMKSLEKKYVDIIFSDIDNGKYDIKRNSMVTLTSGQSVTATEYVLSIDKNDLDKLYKRFLNQAVSDPIILEKLNQIDEQIKKAGLYKQESKSIKDEYISNLKRIADNIEYKGEDNTKISIKVYVLDKKNIRTELVTEFNKYILEPKNEENEKSILYKIEKGTSDGTDIKWIKLGKSIEENKRNIQYEDSSNKLNFEVAAQNKENELDFDVNISYSNNQINQLSLEAKSAISIGKSRTIPNIYNGNSNNVVLNDYDGKEIIEILNILKDRQIKSLETVKTKVNTKMINSILNWIDNKEEEIKNEKMNNIEKQRNRFNNKFELYAGEDLSYDHILKLLKAVSNNMSGYKVENGNKIEIIVENGIQNAEKAIQIKNALKEQNTYDVEVNHSQEGWVNTIDISVHKD